MPDSVLGFPQADSSSLYITSLPDIPPANPTPWDDEFEGNRLNPKWTIWNQVANETITIHDSMVTLDARYDVYQRVFALIQPAPSGNWKFRAKLIIEGAPSNYTGAGLIARRITGADKSLYCMLLFNSGQGIAMTTIWGFGINGVTISLPFESDLYNIQTMKFYMEMEYDGTNITYRISSTGAAYSRIWQYAAATYPGGAPEWVGINLHCLSQATSDPNYPQVMSCDWFRRIA